MVRIEAVKPGESVAVAILGIGVLVWQQWCDGKWKPCLEEPAGALRAFIPVRRFDARSGQSRQAVLALPEIVARACPVGELVEVTNNRGAARQYDVRSLGPMQLAETVDVEEVLCRTWGRMWGLDHEAIRRGIAQEVRRTGGEGSVGGDAEVSAGNRRRTPAAGR